VWFGLDGLLGDSLIARLIEVVVPISLAAGAYLGAMHLLRAPEAGRIIDLVRRRGAGEPV
jgi:hypothetical protein